MTEPTPAEQAIGPVGIVDGLARHVGWTYAHVVVLSTVNVTITAIAVRVLGPAEFGVVSLLLALATAAVVLEFGLGSATIRATARRVAAVDADTAQTREREVAVAHATYVALALALGVGGAVLAALVGVANPDLGVPVAELTSSILVTAGWAAVFVGSAAILGVATGARRFRSAAGCGIAGSIGNLLTVAGLVGPLGMVAVPLGQLVGVLVQRFTLAVVVRRSVSWFSFRPRRVARHEVLVVWGFAAPLLAMALGAQVITITDLVVIGWFSTAAAVGIYRAGSILASQAVSILYRGYDVAFPALAGTEDQGHQEEAARFLGRWASFVAGLGFGATVWYAPQIMELVTGADDPLGVAVLRIFALAWMCNVPAHGLALLLIARGRHRVMAAVVSGEAIINLVLTVVLVAVTGPVGAAWATLVTIALSNTVILPLVVDRQGRPFASGLVWRHGILHVATGLAVASGVALVLRPIGTSAAAAAFGVGLTLLVGAVVGWVAAGGDGRARLRATMHAVRPPHDESR